MSKLLLVRACITSSISERCKKEKMRTQIIRQIDRNKGRSSRLGRRRRRRLLLLRRVCVVRHVRGGVRVRAAWVPGFIVVTNNAKVRRARAPTDVGILHVGRRRIIVPTRVRCHAETRGGRIGHIIASVRARRGRHVDVSRHGRLPTVGSRRGRCLSRTRAARRNSTC